MKLIKRELPWGKKKSSGRCGKADSMVPLSAVLKKADSSLSQVLGEGGLVSVLDSVARFRVRHMSGYVTVFKCLSETGEEFDPEQLLELEQMWALLALLTPCTILSTCILSPLNPFMLMLGQWLVHVHLLVQKLTGRYILRKATQLDSSIILSPCLRQRAVWDWHTFQFLKIDIMIMMS